MQSLVTFHQTANGCKHECIWSDHLGKDHTVTFSKEPLVWHQSGPARYTVTIGLEENILMVLVDENGTTLIDENGDVLTW